MFDLFIFFCKVHLLVQCTPFRYSTLYSFLTKSKISTWASKIYIRCVCLNKKFVWIFKLEEVKYKMGKQYLYLSLYYKKNDQGKKKSKLFMNWLLMVIKILLSKEMNFNIVQNVSECSKMSATYTILIYIVICNICPLARFETDCLVYCGRLYKKNLFFLFGAVVIINDIFWLVFLLDMTYVCIEMVTYYTLLYNTLKGKRSCRHIVQDKIKTNLMIL